MHRSSILLIGTLIVASVVPVACGSGNIDGGSATGGAGGTSSASGKSTASTGIETGGGSFASTGATNDPIVSVTITPQNPVVEVKDGAIPPAVAFSASAKTMSGKIVQPTGTWSYDRFDIASIDPSSGQFTANGTSGGTGTVSFQANGVKGSTSATVKLHFTSDPNMIDPSIKALFGSATTPDPALAWLYPYDQTVFPKGITGPVLQWSGGGASDVYYVHATSSTFEFEGWGTAANQQFTFPTMTNDVWQKLEASTSGDVAVALQRYDGTTAYTPVSEKWTIADANLTGTIYYWAINAGTVVRIQPGQPAQPGFLQLPAGHTCVACHSVSKNGSTIVAALDGGWSPWTTYDAASGANLYDPEQSSGFEAISPDGQYVLWRHWNDGSFDGTGFMSLSKFNDATELAELATGQPQPSQPSHPAWSGDGKHIAFSNRMDGNGLDFTQSNLWITDVDAPNASFTNIHKIIDNDATRTTVTYPTFSPDSAWIAFERSTQARSRGAQADIYLTSIDGSTIIPLDAANRTGILMGPEASSTYEPTFMPVAAGGYFWLVVVSERTYGNTLTVTDPTSRVKQLWVTAIDANPTAGKDPSHPAFWLPGQDITTNNMRGEWALNPCKQVGDTCMAGFDCCNGFCVEGDGGQGMCTDQPPMCSGTGDKCTTSADCCNADETCVGGFCAMGMPK